MSVFAQANDATGQSDDFFAYNATGQVYNGSTFVTWVDANYATYRIAATEAGTSGRYTATLPAGTVRYEVRRRGATLALSIVVWTDDEFAKLSDYLTGDAFARIGLAGAGLTALGDTRIANLDATISSRMATFTYTAPDNATITAIRAEQDADEAAIIAAVGAGVTAVEAFGGSGPWTRNTEPPTLASILAGIITDHGTGSYVDTGQGASQASVDAIADTLGTPAGASLAGDIAGVEAETSSILSTAGKLEMMIVASGGDWQFDTLALALAPVITGGGTLIEILDALDLIAAQTARITELSVIDRNMPQPRRGVLPITRGDAYVGEIAKVITLNTTGILPDDITGSTVWLKVQDVENPNQSLLIENEGEILQPIGAIKVFRFEISAAQTFDLNSELYQGDIEVLIDGDDSRPATAAVLKVIVTKDARDESSPS